MSLASSSFVTAWTGIKTFAFLDDDEEEEVAVVVVVILEEDGIISTTRAGIQPCSLDRMYTYLEREAPLVVVVVAVVAVVVVDVVVPVDEMDGSSPPLA